MTVKDFLRNHRFDTFSSKVENLIDSVLSDMEKSLAKTGGGSQPMIPTFITVPQKVTTGKKVIVIDAGGTNFRSSLCEFFDDGTYSVSNFKKSKMPGTQSELGKDEFFDEIAANLDYLREFAEDEVFIGFCFSYSMEILESGDGRILAITKELKAKNIVGELVGENLVKAMKNRGWKKISGIRLINDTVAALMSASYKCGKPHFSSFVGVILGTGFNSAYTENGKIGKLENSKPQIVVCESGNFCDIPLSDFDETLEKSTLEPGKYIAEKHCSGLYLQTMMPIILSAATSENLFSEKISYALKTLSDFSLVDTDAFLNSPMDDETFFGKILKDGTETDRENLFLLFESVIDRAASVSSAIIAASVIKSSKGSSPLHPVAILCDGTTIHRTYSLFPKIRAHLMEELYEKRGIHFEIFDDSEPITLGTAIAALA